METVSISGFCPTQLKEYSIEVMYQEAAAGFYIQTGADCLYASFNDCPNQSSCPLRAAAPKNRTF